jgi:hypothetical protein
LLLAIFRNGDLAYNPFTIWNASELNKFEKLGTNTFFARKYTTGTPMLPIC